MIDCAPEVMHLPIYLHKDFIQMPLPITGVHSRCPALFDPACKLGAKPVPPVPYGFIAKIHTAFMQEVFDIPKSKRKSHIQPHRDLDDLRTGFEIEE